MSKNDLLKRLPAVDELLRSTWSKELLQSYSQSEVAQWVRMGVDACREKFLSGDPLESAQAVTDWISNYVESLTDSDRGQSVRRVLNATGVVLHTNLGRAPLATAAIARMHHASGYANVELDLDSGERSWRGARAARMLAEMVGADDAVIVNNCAGATMLVLQAVAAGREVIIARGQLVEIGGGFRLPDVFTAAGVRLREVGTTNRTYVRDYSDAIVADTGAIMRVHHSNFHQSGFVTEPEIAELVQCSGQHAVELAVIDDLGSGCVHDLTKYGFDEPTVQDSVRAGADLTLFSGDKLFGGPQCGMIVGRQPWIDRLKEHPMMRAMRCDKLTLAALEATIELHVAGKAFSEIPVLQMIALEAEVVREQCQKLVDALDDLDHTSFLVVPSESQVGGGSIPGRSLPSFAVSIKSNKAETLANRLRQGDCPVQGYVREDRVMLDLRTVAEQDLELLVGAIRNAIGTVSGAGEPSA